MEAPRMKQYVQRMVTEGLNQYFQDYTLNDCWEVEETRTLYPDHRIDIAHDISHKINKLFAANITMMGRKHIVVIYRTRFEGSDASPMYVVQEYLLVDDVLPALLEVWTKEKDVHLYGVQYDADIRQEDHER